MLPRISPLAAGAVLIAVGIGVAATMHESAMAFLIVLAGAALCLYEFLGDRLKSVGPKGIELFEQIRDRTAEQMEQSATDSVGVIGEEVEATVTRGHAAAAAAIRAAKTPEEMADVLVSIMETPETTAEQMSRIRGDDAARTKRDRYGPSAGSRG